MGGAAIAARRLMYALQKEDVNVNFLVSDRQLKNKYIHQAGRMWQRKICFLWERFCIWLNSRFHKKHLFEIDIANIGIDITSHPLFKEADIIHLHWINQGFLSLKQIQKIVDSGKPIVWTMHDLWTATGICHCTFDCKQFETMCQHCPLLVKSSKHDLAYRIFKKKARLWENSHITFVGCSEWTAQEAHKSALLKAENVIHLPNTLDTTIFQPTNQQEARIYFGLPQKKKLLLFASMNIRSRYKGVSYLIEACRLLAKNHPSTLQDCEIVVLGNASESIKNEFSYPVHCLPYQTQEENIALVYNAVDFYITPSLQDNLPNTVMEAMACGTPCIGFATGGIPEMINHKVNGYIAPQRDAKALSEGIWWSFNQTQEKLSQAARKKIMDQYAPSKIAQKFKTLYASLLSEN
jgi:glycosyltransferase involved in cell wall biosynthesis